MLGEFDKLQVSTPGVQETAQKSVVGVVDPAPNALVPPNASLAPSRAFIKSPSASASASASASPTPYLPSCSTWSPVLAARVAERCHVYLRESVRWLKADMHGSAIFRCLGPHQCGGHGDRLGALVTLFNVALTENRRLRVTHWPGLHRYFEPCALNASERAQWQLGVPEEVSNPACPPPVVNVCAPVFPSNATCLEGGARFLFPNRLCTHTAMCAALKQQVPGLNVVETLGCPMRLLMEPNRKFLHETVFTLRNGLVVLPNLTMTMIESVMQQYFVIGVQVRMGDEYLSDQPPSMSRHLEFWERAVKCAKTVEWHHSQKQQVRHSLRVVTGPRSVRDNKVSFSSPVFVNGKRVKWLVLSDSEEVRQSFISLLDDNVLHLEMVSFFLQFVN